MGNRMTLGQYYQTDSVLHRLDPRVKLTGTIVYIATLFVADNLWGYLLATAFLIVAIALSKVPVRFMLKGMRSIALLIALTVVFNLFMTPGEILVRFWRLTVTY